MLDEVPVLVLEGVPVTEDVFVLVLEDFTVPEDDLELVEVVDVLELDAVLVPEVEVDDLVDDVVLKGFELVEDLIVPDDECVVDVECDVPEVEEDFLVDDVEPDEGFEVVEDLVELDVCDVPVARQKPSQYRK